MGVYDEERAMVKEMIEEFGRAIALRLSSRTPANAAKPWRGSAAPHTGSSPTSVTTTGVFVPLSAMDELGFAEKNTARTLIKRGTKACLVAAAGLTPADTDVSRYDAILDGDEILSIVDVQILAPGEQTILYAFEVTS